MSLFDAINNRRDTRHFLPDVVPDAVLKLAFDAAQASPSVGLSQPTKYYLINKLQIKQSIHHLFSSASLKAKSRIKDETQLKNYTNLKLEGILEAPLGLIITTDYSVMDNFTIGTEGTADALQWSSVCGLQNFWLTLTQQGYSLGWVSILDYDGLKKLINLPSHEKPLGYFCIGKPATNYNNKPMLENEHWKVRKPISIQTIEMVNEIKSFEPSKLNLTDCVETNFELSEKIKSIIDNKLKPKGSLGMLETIAHKVATIQQSLTPVILNPTIIIFAADHGIASTGLVNQYPQEVTAHMVKHFIKGDAAINVFSKQHNINVVMVDAGVNHTFQKDSLPTHFIDAKINYGSRNYLEQDAMSLSECENAILKGREITKHTILSKNCNTIGFGEMGIGNSSSAALLMSAITKIQIADCIGIGAGANGEELTRKKELLTSVFNFYYNNSDTYSEHLCHFGGYEIAMMVGAYLEACEQNCIVVVDGFIATAALLVACEINNDIINNCIFAHTSAEKAHTLLLNYLKVEPILNLGMRLGEGTGIAMAMPIIQSAVDMINNMGNFDFILTETKNERTN